MMNEQSEHTHTHTYHVVEDEAGVGEFKVFEQAVELAAV